MILNNHDIEKDPFCDGSEIAGSQERLAFAANLDYPAKAALLRGFSHSGKPKSTKAISIISIPDPERNDTATRADPRNHKVALRDQRMANFPVQAQWIYQASQSPAVRLADREYF